MSRLPASKLLRAMLTACWVFGSGPTARAASITDLGDLGGAFEINTVLAIAADGRVALGKSSSTTPVNPQFAPIDAYRWTFDGGIEQLPRVEGGMHGSGAGAASADGNVVVGSSSSNHGAVAIVWTRDTGTVAIGEPFGGVANTVSADGSIVFGRHFAANGPGFSVFRWTQESGAVELSSFSGGINDRVIGASDDGSRMVGTDNLGSYFLWDGGFVSPITVFAQVSGISGDGLTLFGGVETVDGPRAAAWSQARGLIPFGALPGNRDEREGWLYSSQASAATPDGSVIVGGVIGATDDFQLPERFAFVWDETNGIRVLEDVLRDSHGVDTTGFALESASDVSGDGRVIVGTGEASGSSSLDRSWIAVLPAPDARSAHFIAIVLCAGAARNRSWGKAGTAKRLRR